MVQHNRSKRPPPSNFLLENNEYLIPYYQLLKDAATWHGSGQYWLERESQRRATALELGNIAEYEFIKHSEDLFFKTKKFM